MTQQTSDWRLVSQPGAMASGPLWRWHARILLGGWIAFTLVCAGVCVVSLVARYQLLLHPAADLRAEMASLGISPSFHAAWNIALESLVALSYLGTAALIVWRKSRDTAALTMALALVAFGAGMPGTVYAVLSDQPIWTEPFGFLQTVGWLMLLIFAFLFPNGRFVPRWTLPLVIPWVLWVVGFFLFAGVIARERPWAVGLAFGVWALWFVVGAAAQYYRYVWVSSWGERQQTKWVVFGFLGMLLGVFAAVSYHVASLIGVVSGDTSIVLRFAAVILLCATALLVPLTVGIAMLRYRLFDVDVLINRTLVYGSLSVTLALTYLVAVVLLEVLFSGISQRSTQGSEVAITISTLLIAALFQPLRGRVQRGINQRFYRSNYNASQTIASFAAKLPSLVDLEQLHDGVLSAVHDTMHPSFATLWMVGASHASHGTRANVSGQPDDHRET
jgi:hypothetical protein